jgi:glycosyltransferase involved in cell wall biosynthesis
VRPDVTAVIPTHNRAQLLATTLRTVLWQRDVALEVIVVDDGSSENIATVIEQFADSRVRLVRHEVPQGVSLARNHGAAEAGAPWLAFCDDDDLWAPDKIARQLAAAQALGRAWSYGGAVHVNTALRVLSAIVPPPPERLVAVLPRWNTMPGGSSNVIVLAELFQAVGGWDPGLINLADWDLWARLAREALPACVERPLVGYRIHAGNASANTELILREARQMNRRPGARLDFGELHHYLAWVHLRAGRRRPAVPHLMKAAAHGQVTAVGKTMLGIMRHRAARWLPALSSPLADVRAEWVAESEAWIAPLREALGTT